MFKKLIILSTFTLFSGLCIAQEGMKSVFSSSQYKDKADKVTEFYLNGKWALNIEANPVQAGTYFATALTLDSMHAPTHYEIAGMMRDPNKALKHIERAVDGDSTNITYLYLLSSLYADSGNIPKAIEVGEKILSIDNKTQRNYLYLLSLRAMNKEQQKALSLLDTIKVKFGDSEELNDYKAEVISTMTATPELIAQIEEMIKNTPEDKELKILLGNKYAMMGQDSVAESIYKDMLANEPENIRATVSLFDLYNSRGDKELVMDLMPSIFEAKEVIVSAKIDMFINVLAKDEYYQTKYLNELIGFAESLVRQYPDNYDVVKLYVQELLFAKKGKEALDVLKKSVQDGVGGIGAITGVMDLEARAGNINAAIEYCDIALEKYPNERVALISTKSYFLTLNKEEKRAVELLKEEIKNSSDSTYRSFLHTSIGDTYSLMLDQKKAIENYKKAIAYNASNIVALNNYAYLLSESGHNLDKALSMSLMVINKEPSNPTYLDTYAWILYMMGRYDEAQKAMSKAIALDTTNNSVLLLHYGDILDKLNQRIVAEKYWKKALEAGADAAEIEKRIGTK